MFKHLTKSEFTIFAVMIASAALSGYIIPTEAAKLIGTKDIADNAITTSKIANGAVTLPKFAAGVADSLKGTNGVNGINGINCWDLNENRVNETSEDVNKDNTWTALDCQGSVHFVANSPPKVDAGNDQNLQGTITHTGGGIGGATFDVLTCTFPLDGIVTDDEFTGYLAHKWTAGGIGSAAVEEDEELTTNAIVIFQVPSMSGPITTPVQSIATLIADDGILTASDEVTLVCTPPLL